MKVLIFITQFYQLGGAERLAVELAEELNKRDIHADILSMYTEDLPGVAEAKRDLLDRGIPRVHFLGMKVRPSLVSAFSAIRRLRGLIREGGYDIVETSMVSPTVLAAWATRGTHARHVAGLHQVFLRDRENGAQHKLWRLSIRCNKRTRYYAITHCVATAWAAYSGVPQENTRTVYNAISDDYYDLKPDRAGVRVALGVPSDARIVLSISRLARYKGCDTLLEAIGPLLEERDLHLVYVGAPDENQDYALLMEEMETLIEKEGCRERVHFLGFRNDASRFLSAADLLAHPTRIEGFGLVLAEALAAGLPIVASNVQGIPEVLAGTDSIMIPPDDAKALREAIVATLDRTPEETERIIEKGRKRAEDFRTEYRVDAMTRLFEDVINDRF
jgi:glycosyltransferase involved in cell wall biosynthesis